VDAGFSPDFATSVLTNNILLSKRVMQTQDQFTPLLTEHMRKHAMNSEKLVNDLKKILDDNFAKLKVGAEKETKKKQADLEKDRLQPDVKLPTTGGNENKHISEVDAKLAKEYVIGEFLREFLLSFEVSLPRPNSVTLENQATAMDTFTKMLDAALESWISDAFFTTETGGDVAAQVTTLKQMLRAHFIRQWMAENGVMPELASLTTQDETGKPAVDIFKINEAHVKGLMKSMSKFMKDLQPAKDASNKIMAGLDVDTTTTSSGTPDNDLDSVGDGSSGSGDFDMPGLDDLGGGLPEDAGGGEGGAEGSETSSTETEESKTSTNADGSTSSSSSSSSSSTGGSVV
jgi:hypothetical protein